VSRRYAMGALAPKLVMTGAGVEFKEDEGYDDDDDDDVSFSFVGVGGEGVKDGSLDGFDVEGS